MTKWLLALAGLALLLGLLTGCGGESLSEDSAAVSSDATSSASEADAADTGEETALSVQEGDMFTDRDLDGSYEESGSVLIQLEGDSASASSDSVQISGSTVTITQEGTYLLTGTLEDGMVIVDAPDSAKVQLVLAGVDITSATSAALYVRQADKVFVTLAEGTENSLANGGSFTAIDEYNIDAALFSRDDLTLNGAGSLAVTSPAGHGITCKDDLVITGGSYTITAASHGLEANDSIRVTGDTVLTVTAGKDGLHAENDEDTELGFVYLSGGTFQIQAEGDGISAGAWLRASEGSYQILAGGGSENGENESSEDWGSFMGRGGGSGQQADLSGGGDDSEDGGDSDGSGDSSTSMKGLKAGGALVVTGGSFTIDSADDGVHSNASITVEGGSFEIATGDDGFHADDTLTVSGGSILITESYEGLEALHVLIQGGEITLTASDDGLNAAGGADESGVTGGRDGRFGGGAEGGGFASSSDGTIVISGGSLYINASGDGIDANGSIEITGGDTVVVGPTQGDTSTLDYDTTATITGGTFLGTGGAGMAQSFSSSEQGVIAVQVGSQSAGASVVITDSEGNVLLEYAPELSFAVVIYSSPDIVSGQSYTVSAGTVTGQVEAN